jgi:lipooligosaccharide transport system permease protein
VNAHLIVLRHLWVLRARRPWTLIVNGIFEPFLYLMSIGVGIGALIDAPAGAPSYAAPNYAAYIAPALLATAAMNAAVNEVVNDVWWRIRFEHVYQAMLTTPLTVTDIAVGEVAAAMLRGAVAATGFLAVITALGLAGSWWALLAVPATLLVTFAFAGAGLAVATVIREFHHHQYVQLVMLPMFLFATTFYPLSVYPKPLQVVVAALPLYQSTELLRGLVLGDLGPGLAWAAVYLAAMGLGGLFLADRRLPKLLIG